MEPSPDTPEPGARRVAAEHATTRVLAEATTLAEAAPRILSTICESLDWDLGALWVVDPLVRVLRCVETWRLPHVAISEFTATTRAHVFAPGVGLPGRVWAQAEPAWIEDVAFDSNFPRGPVARREGLHAAFGFPIRRGDEVLGVFEFFSREIRKPDTELLATMATIGSQIGQFIERKRAEQAVREGEASRRFQALLLDTVGEAVIATDPDGTIRFWNRFAEELYGWSAAEVLGRNIGDGSGRLPRAGGWRDGHAEPRRALDGRVSGPSAGRTSFLAMVTNAPVVNSQGALVGIVGVSSDISERKRIEGALAERTRQLEAVRAVSQEIARELDLTRLLRLITRRAVELVGAASGVVWLRAPGGDSLMPWAWHGLGDWLTDARHATGEGVLGEAARRREALIVNDLTGSPFASAEPDRLLIERGGVTGMLAEPLLYRGDLVGAITVHNHGAGRLFVDQDRALLALFADQAAVAIENARLYDQLPALAVTAYARPEDRDAALAAGFTEHLAKPVDPHVLIRAVARLAGRPVA